MRPRLPLAACCAAATAALCLASATPAQVIVSPRNFEVSTVAEGIVASGESMAVDRFGNVYVLDQPTDPAGFPATVTRVTPDGVVHPGHAGPFGHVGELATNPTDGAVYLVTYAPLLPVIHSDVYRIEPTGGATHVGGVVVVADGFTIDDQGHFYFGGMGLSGPGLYVAKAPAGGFGAEPQFVSPGFGANAELQSLVTGDVLIADGHRVERWIPGQLATVPFYSAPLALPNELVNVVGLARGPMYQLGVGSMIGVNHFGTFCFCGTGSAVSTGPTGDLFSITSALFAHEDYQFPNTGLSTIASGIRQDLYWLSDVKPSPVGTPGKVLTRITQLPAKGSMGSLFASASPFQASFDAFGPQAGGDPFLLGVALQPSPSTPGHFLPPWGFIDLYPYAPGYIALLDGVGAFGPPNPFAVYPVGGQFSIAFPVPPGLSGFVFDSQVLTLSGLAPNGFFFISNVAELAIP
jgi:hypothetical protein